MKPVTLTREQRAALLERLEGVRLEDGVFDITVDLEDVTLTATGEVELEGYREDDYYSGTGAWMETGRRADVEVLAWDEDGRYHPVDKETRDEAYALLNRE